MCMLSTDPQCTHILLLYCVKNGYKRDLFIMFFCSSLSRTKREEYDGKTQPVDSG